MKKIIYTCLLLFFTLSMAGCGDSFLTRPPMDDLTDKTYWTSEANVETFAWGFYEEYFGGYGQGYGLGKFYGSLGIKIPLNDNYAPSTPPEFQQEVPSSGGSWTFAWVRKANIMIERIPDVPMEEEAINHWMGIARFFRALEYAELVRRFGDVPWYGQVLQKDETDKLYKERTPRTAVMDSVLADFQYAVENVRLTVEEPGLTVNKDVVLALMSRVFLFEGTWLKYHEIDQAKAEAYLQVAKEAANTLIESGRYTLGNDYRSLFNSLSLADNPGIILYRKYEYGVLTHSLNTYSNKEPQIGISKDAIDSYLCTDGLPISLSSAYQGDKTIDAVFANRDPRMAASFVQELRLSGLSGKFSTSGYAQHKFLNEEIADQPQGNSNDNPTDAPVIRYGEVLLNYAEAAAELGNLTQADLDKSINKLRSRPGINLPPLQTIGGMPAVNGQTYDDPQRDPSVPSMIWEIRRARRVELMMEGFRLNDLRRWHKLEYADMAQNPEINRGAWISRSDYPDAEVTIENGADAGYIIPASSAQDIRKLYDPRVYLWPIPMDQITLYDNHGATLEQNPGW